MPALAALHSHRLADDLVVSNLVLGFALIAQKLQSLAFPSRDVRTSARTISRIPGIRALARPLRNHLAILVRQAAIKPSSRQRSVTRCCLMEARVSASGAPWTHRSHIST